MKNGTRSYEVNQNNEALFTEKLFREPLFRIVVHRTFVGPEIIFEGTNVQKTLFTRPFWQTDFHLSFKKKQDRVQAPRGRPHRQQATGRLRHCIQR